jgi:hypothetical protein
MPMTDIVEISHGQIFSLSVKILEIKSISANSFIDIIKENKIGMNSLI